MTPMRKWWGQYTSHPLCWSAIADEMLLPASLHGFVTLSISACTADCALSPTCSGAGPWPAAPVEPRAAGQRLLQVFCFLAALPSECETKQLRLGGKRESCRPATYLIVRTAVWLLTAASSSNFGRRGAVTLLSAPRHGLSRDCSSRRHDGHQQGFAGPAAVAG